MRDSILCNSSFLIVILLAAMLIFTGCSKDTSRDTTTKITDTNEAEDTQDVVSTPSIPSTPTAPVTPICGDNNLDAGEQCDGTNIPAASCQSNGYDSGSVRCSSSCSLDFSACVKNANTFPCTDSDGGLNYTVKGIVTVTTNGSSTTFTDYCRHGSSEGYIVEYSCGDAGVVTNSYRCPKKCNNNGACY
jgi:hypothetical protein